MVDISTSGITLAVAFATGGTVLIQPSELSAERDPVSIGQIQSVIPKFSMDGDLVPTQRMASLRIAIYLIPGSKSDLKMSENLYAGWDEGVEKARVASLLISYPSGKKDLLKDGFVTSGAFGPSISRDGRFVGGEYVFEFMQGQLPRSGTGKYGCGYSN